MLLFEKNKNSEKLAHEEKIDIVKRTKLFFQTIKTYSLDEHVVTHYVNNYQKQLDLRLDFQNLHHKELKQKIQQSYHDLWIAATCLANNLILVTNNKKDFDFISSLNIQNWTK
jgi:predicted nucleic acid-binding protein